MRAFILETLLLRGWKRGGEVFWTLGDAEREAKSQMRRKTIRAYRVLPVEVDLEAVASVLPESPGVPSVVC